MQAASTFDVSYLILVCYSTAISWERKDRMTAMSHSSIKVLFSKGLIDRAQLFLLPSNSTRLHVKYTFYIFQVHIFRDNFTSWDLTQIPMDYKDGEMNFNLFGRSKHFQWIVCLSKLVSCHINIRRRNLKKTDDH